MNDDKMTLEEYFADLFDEMIANDADTMMIAPVPRDPMMFAEKIQPYPTEENGKFEVASMQELQQFKLDWATFCDLQR